MNNLFILIFTFLSAGLVAQKNIDFVSYLPYEDRLNDIWGYVDGNGNEYALVGTQVSTSIVDVSDPSNPLELHVIFGDTTIWRDIKTWDNFAYVTNESAGGLLIIDLNFLPDSVYFERLTEIDTFNFQKAHNLFIDENGVGYIVGSNILNQGALMLDLNAPNKFAPPLLGIYDDRYVHDCYARGDTLWTAEIVEGTFSAIDVSDKQNPIVLARQITSMDAAHNCWLSPNGNFLATTDEVKAATVDMYDVSDLGNIDLLDTYKSSPEDSVIPHNTYFIDDNYLVTSYYRDGVTIVDATKKDNLVEVGFYDTSPLPPLGKFNGAWGVYPFAPSGLLYVADIEEGLFLLNPTYDNACYLEGNITDETTNNPIRDIRVEFIGEDNSKFSNLFGDYKTGIVDSGEYDIRFYHPFCETVIIANVELNKSATTILDVEMNCDFTLSVDNEKTSSISIYPNPFNDVLKFKFSGNENLETIEIFDIKGELIAITEVNSKNGSVILNNNWIRGVYLAKFNYENSSKINQIVRL